MKAISPKTPSTDRSSVDSLDYALRTLKQASVMTTGDTATAAGIAGSGHRRDPHHSHDTDFTDAHSNCSNFGERSDSERSLHSRSHSPEGVGSFELTGSIEMQNKKLHRKVHSLQKELHLLQRKYRSQECTRVEIQRPVNVTLDSQYMAEMADNLFKLADELETRRKAQEEQQKTLESEIIELEKQKKKVQVEWTTLKDTAMMIEFRKKQYDHKLKKFKESIFQSREWIRDSRKDVEKYVKQQWHRLRKMTKEFEEKLVNKIKTKKDEVRKETLQERERLAAEFELKRETLLQELERREVQVEERARKTSESRKRIEKLKDDLKNCEGRIKANVKEERRKVCEERKELTRMRAGLNAQQENAGSSREVRGLVEGCKAEMESVKESIGKLQTEVLEKFMGYFSSTIQGIDQKIQTVDRLQNDLKPSAHVAQLAELVQEEGEIGENAPGAMEGFEIVKERERLKAEMELFEKDREAFLKVQEFFEEDTDFGTLAQRVTRFKAEKEQFDKDKEKLKLQTIEFEIILKEKQQQFEQAQANWQNKLSSERATINKLKKELIRITSLGGDRRHADFRFQNKQTSI